MRAITELLEEIERLTVQKEELVRQAEAREKRSADWKAMAQKTRKTNRELRAKYKEAEQRARNAVQQSLTDSVTNIPNRRHFEQWALETVLPRLRRYRDCVYALILFDLDGFKHVNDAYGHQAGDEVLKTVAQKVSGALREGEDFFARVGGDEFAILSKAGPEEAATLVDRLHPVIEDAVVGAVREIAANMSEGAGYANARAHVGVSFGVGFLKQDEGSSPRTEADTEERRRGAYSQAYRNADNDLYKAKRRKNDNDRAADIARMHRRAISTIRGIQS